MTEDNDPLPWLSRVCGRQITEPMDVICLLDIEAEMSLAEEFPPPTRHHVQDLLRNYLRGTGRITLHHELVSWISVIPELDKLLEDDRLNDTAYRSKIFYLALTGSRLLPLTPRRLTVCSIYRS